MLTLRPSDLNDAPLKKTKNMLAFYKTEQEMKEEKLKEQRRKQALNKVSP